MPRFSADWLALREAADIAARSPRLTLAVASALPHDRVARVIDLATGGGSNLRYLVEHLPFRQDWLLVDNDSDLLGELIPRTQVWATSRGYETVRDANGWRLERGQLSCRMATRVADLSAIDRLPLFERRDLVTASALLDLVSDRWLRALVRRCRQAAASVLFVLTYDGRIRCEPEDPEDEQVRDLVNLHQRSDKGFGAALGPDAAGAAKACLAAEGYRVSDEASDWVLPPESAALQRSLVEGWAEAAAAIAPHESGAIAGWRARRLRHITGRDSRMVVGHVDLAGFPSGQ